VRTSGDTSTIRGTRDEWAQGEHRAVVFGEILEILLHVKDNLLWYLHEKKKQKIVPAGAG